MEENPAHPTDLPSKALAGRFMTDHCRSPKDELREKVADCTHEQNLNKTLQRSPRPSTSLALPLAIRTSPFIGRRTAYHHEHGLPGPALLEATKRSQQQRF
jgi:hypothetical protein